MSHNDTGKKEPNLIRNTSMQATDEVRVVIGQSSRNISLQNFSSSISPLLTTPSMVRLIRTETSNTGLLITDEVLRMSAVGGDISVNLLSAASTFDVATQKGQLFVIKKIDDDATPTKVTLNPSGGELIDGQATFELVGPDRVFATIISNGTGWDVIG